MTERYDHSDVCLLNAAGPQNGYMASTYSLPPSIEAPNGNQALYTCREPVSSGTYAQCDGGICFTSSSGRTFPGSTGPIGANQIICACPITVAEPGTTKRGYQIIGPYPCQASHLRYCDGAVTNNNNGTTIPSGATTGGIRLFTRLLYGSVPKLNECHFGSE
jgi:hypothetical protein